MPKPFPTILAKFTDIKTAHLISSVVQFIENWWGGWGGGWPGEGEGGEQIGEKQHLSVGSGTDKSC